MSTPSASSAAGAAPVSLFYSYAHEDAALRAELQGHLKILERRKLLAPWHDREIVPGMQWSDEIDAHLRSAELVLLLVSKDFIASDYIFGVELKEALRRQERKETTVVPIIVRAVDLAPEDAEDLPFLKLQALPTDLRPVTSWPNRDEAWTDVAKGLRATVNAIRAQRPPAAPPTPLPQAAPHDFGGFAAPEEFVDFDRLELPAAPEEFVDFDGFKPPAAPDEFDACYGFEAPPVPPARAPGRFRVGAPDGSGHGVRGVSQPCADPILTGVVDGVVARVQQARAARHEPPLLARDVGALREGAMSLIDMEDPRRVLWVDDRPGNNVHEAGMLARLQIEVVAVRSTEEALRTIGQDREGFDLVISDWDRPLDGAAAGLDLLRKLRTQGRALPFVFYHAAQGGRRVGRAREAGAAGALGEAVMPEELLALVRTALAGR